ncbi:hypothetical protein [Adhaeribacter pallidiroseus]|uniref:Uncharacterized protein n=1 Tax=Adhaeribacter pallidiroseus TaxID=2072847 RepID=A0A369QSD4_9BACT|nr:hypothetical protein [Adhaeribacter pallidiroseus]RDC66127.1 hypothetical protein AHMF7616_04758 [Adhaeribacter pallidiroseus]
MLLEKLFTVYVYFQTLWCGCAADRKHAGFLVNEPKYRVEKTGRMAKKQVKESSGLELAPDNITFWTHADSGNPPQLYQVNSRGQLLNTFAIPQTTNLDWEDVAKDDLGYLYIGDFGNNSNSRQNLRIYRIKENNFAQVDTISFVYPDQKAFPPVKAKQNFNCEAFFYFRNKLYLFSKNRGTRGWVKMYTLPAQPGTYTASLTDSLKIASRITAADISPDGQTIALLGYGNIYLYSTDAAGSFFAGKKNCLAIPATGQAEAILFINNHELIISNEGGKLFRIAKK